MDEPDLTGGFVALLGLKFDEASADRVVIRLHVRPELHQPFGIQHGVLGPFGDRGEEGPSHV